MITQLELILQDLEAGVPYDELVHRVKQALGSARECHQREGILREVVRSGNAQYEERVLELSVLKEAGDIVAGSLTMDNPLAKILEVLKRQLDADHSSILRISETSGELRAVAVSRAGADVTSVSDDILDQETRRLEGIGSWVAARGEPLIVPDLSRDVRFNRRDGDTEGSLIAVPLRASDRVVGMLTLSSSQRSFFQPSHARVLRIVGSQVAAALAGLELHEKLRDFNAQLEGDVRERTAELELKTEDLRRKNEMITDLYFSLEEAQTELEERNREMVRTLVFNDNIVETINVGIGVFSNDGKVLTWNRAMESITRGALSKENTLGKNLDEVPPDARDAFGLGQELDDALAFGRAATQTNHEVEIDDEQKIHVNVNLLPVPLPPDGGNHVIAVLEDVTLNTILADEQVKAERLEAITATMVSVNHEVNNPLAVILGYIQMMTSRFERGGDPEKILARAKTEAATIESEALRIHAITAKLAALIEPVVTQYPASGDVKMVDLGRSR